MDHSSAVPLLKECMLRDACNGQASRSFALKHGAEGGDGAAAPDDDSSTERGVLGSGNGSLPRLGAESGEDGFASENEPGFLPPPRHASRGESLPEFEICRGFDGEGYEAPRSAGRGMDDSSAVPLLKECMLRDACNGQASRSFVWKHGAEGGEGGAAPGDDVLTEHGVFGSGNGSLSRLGAESGEDGFALEDKSGFLPPHRHASHGKTLPECEICRGCEGEGSISSSGAGAALQGSSSWDLKMDAFRWQNFMSNCESPSGEYRFAFDKSPLLKPERDASCQEEEAALEESLLPEPEKQDPRLTCFKVVRGVLSLLILLSTAFVTLIFLAPITSLLLRFISIHYSRKVTSFIFGQWLAMWPFFFEKVNRTKVVFSGDHVPNGERVIVLCNHRTEVDWMYIWNLALRKGRLGYIKYVVKSSVRNAPIFGWAFHVLEFLLIDRNWKVDEPAFESLLSTFKNPNDPLWLVLFPEGTDFTEEKCHRSQKYAEEHGLPKLKHVLLPRTKGFYACLIHLRESVTAVYDLTMGYKYKNPLFMNNACGTGPSEVHIHIKRTAVSNIPISEAGISEWLIEEFHKKDELLSTFYKKGKFPNSGTETELSTLLGVFNICIILACTCLLLSLMLFFSYWIEVYIALSCVYLAAATYFNYKQTPIVQYFKSS